MTEMALTDARKQFTQLDEVLAVHHLVWVLRHNRRAFAIVSIEWLEAMQQTMEIMKSPEEAKVLFESLEALKKGLPHDAG